MSDSLSNGTQNSGSIEIYVLGGSRGRYSLYNDVFWETPSPERDAFSRLHMKG